MDLIIKNVKSDVVNKLKDDAELKGIELNDYIVSIITDQTKDEYDVIDPLHSLQIGEYEEFMDNIDDYS